MTKTKGTDIVSLRKVFQEQGAEREKAFVVSLPSDLQLLYQTALHNTWTLVEKQTELYQRAAEFLYPGSPDIMRKLGKAMAGKSFSTVYRLFLRIPTLAFVIARTAQIWGTYYDRGRASVEDFQPLSGARFVVRDVPDLPRALREVVCGHLEVILELTGCLDIRIDLEEEPGQWIWRLRWR